MAVVPLHCFAVAGPEQIWPIPHCVPSEIVPHAGHFPQSHFPLVHVHVVVPPLMSLQTGALPFAVAPSVLQLSPVVGSGLWGASGSLVQLSHPEHPCTITITSALAARPIKKSHFML